MRKHRPADVDVREWEGLFEYVAWKLALIVGTLDAPGFLHGLCDAERFAHVKLLDD